MPALSFAPALSLLAAFQRVSPVRPLRTLLRIASESRHPSHPQPYVPLLRHARQTLLAGGTAPDATCAATLLREPGRGPTPTIVLGGFVPESTEQVFLLRHFFLRSGDLYYLNYPRHGFSLDLLCAQLDDLVDELAARDEPPILFAVSFGAGLALEWLRRARVAGRHPPLAGLVLVSPIACVADLIAPGADRATTLLGRALQPYLDPAAVPRPDTVERSRQIFARMFAAGAQNKAALRTLMTPAELGRLHAAVMDAIRGIDAAGALQRVQALRTMAAPSAYFSPALLPLSPAPTLILFAENEDAVLDAASPTRFVLANAHRAYFPSSRALVVRSTFGTPVPHASLIFHVFDFLPPLAAFYQRSKPGKFRRAA